MSQYYVVTSGCAYGSFHAIVPEANRCSTQQPLLSDNAQTLGTNGSQCSCLIVHYVVVVLTVPDEAPFSEFTDSAHPQHTAPVFQSHIYLYVPQNEQLFSAELDLCWPKVHLLVIISLKVSRGPEHRSEASVTLSAAGFTPF